MSGKYRDRFPRNVADSGACDLCDEEIPTDRDDEYRTRIAMEDTARNGASWADGKVCSDCWWDLADRLWGVE